MAQPVRLGRAGLERHFLQWHSIQFFLENHSSAQSTGAWSTYLYWAPIRMSRRNFVWLEAFRLSKSEEVPVTEPKSSDIHGDKPAAASTQGLEDHKELATFAFQRTRMPIVVADARQPDYPIVLANDAFLRLTGYSAEELLGRNCRLLQGESTSKEAVAEIRAILSAEREGTVEILNYRKDGSAFWNQLHLSPIRDDDGGLAYYFASQIDFTEYRKIQTLEEAEHRYKERPRDCRQHRTVDPIGQRGDLCGVCSTARAGACADAHASLGKRLAGGFTPRHYISPSPRLW
jgi:PAS domain S-box-containing protein